MWLTIGIASIGLAVTSVFVAHAQIPPPDEPKSWIPERPSPEEDGEGRVHPPLSEREREEASASQRRRLVPADGVLTPKFTSVESCITDGMEAHEKRDALPPYRPTPVVGRGPRPSELFTRYTLQADRLIKQKKFDAAFEMLDRAAQHAERDPGKELRLEMLRSSAFEAMDKPLAEILSLERQLSLGILPKLGVENNCSRIEELINQLNRQSGDPVQAE